MAKAEKDKIERTSLGLAIDNDLIEMADVIGRYKRLPRTAVINRVIRAELTDEHRFVLDEVEDRFVSESIDDKEYERILGWKPSKELINWKKTRFKDDDIERLEEDIEDLNKRNSELTNALRTKTRGRV